MKSAQHAKSDRSELRRLWPKIFARKEHLPIVELRRMCASHSANARLTGLLIMRRQIERGRCTIGYMRLAMQMIGDSDDTCRWQALIVVGEFIESHPDEVWSVIEEYGQSEDEDMRMGVACVLLEHLLEHHRRRFRRRAGRLASKSPEFKYTLDMCCPYN